MFIPILCVQMEPMDGSNPDLKATDQAFGMANGNLESLAQVRV